MQVFFKENLRIFQNSLQIAFPVPK